MRQHLRALKFKLYCFRVDVVRIVMLRFHRDAFHDMKTHSSSPNFVKEERRNICLRASPELLDALEIALGQSNSCSLGKPISRSAFVRRLLAERLDLLPAQSHPVSTDPAKDTPHD